MSFVVIGTQHEFQGREAGFEGMLRALLDQRWIEPLTAIAEEFDEAIGDSSVAQRLAFERHLCWCNVDMTRREKQDAGILQEQDERLERQKDGNTYRVPSDDVRENWWVEKLVRSCAGTTLVICGYLHFEPLVQKLGAKGHRVYDRRVYLSTVPTIVSAEDRTSTSGTPGPSRSHLEAGSDSQR